MATFSHKDSVVGTNAALAKFLYNPSSMDDMVAVATKGDSIIVARVILDMASDDKWETEKASIRWFDMATTTVTVEEVSLTYQKSKFPLSDSLEQLMLERGYADVQICHF